MIVVGIVNITQVNSSWQTCLTGFFVVLFLFGDCFAGENKTYNLDDFNILLHTVKVLKNYIQKH